MASTRSTGAGGLPQFHWQAALAELPSARRKAAGTRAYRYLKSVYGWLKHETLNQTRLPWKHKLGMWRRGFFAESAALYELERNDPGEYLSDFSRAARWREVNAHDGFFNHKLILRSFLLAMGFRQAETLALINQGRIVGSPFGGDARHIEPDELMKRLLAGQRHYILKPEDGASGRDVFLLENRGNELMRRRGRGIEQFDLRGLLRSTAAKRERTHMILIEEWLEQGRFWRDLFPESANTLRLVTLWTQNEPDPFIARAIQRIGTAETVPTDNWSGGGISAPVDLASGSLGPGRMHPRKGRPGERMKRLKHHPDSGAQIEGAVLPHWHEVTGTVLRAAASLPFNRMTGWDVLVTGDGQPVIIEGNANGDIDLIQVHGGLLADPRVRRFHEAAGSRR